MIHRLIAYSELLVWVIGAAVVVNIAVRVLA